MKIFFTHVGKIMLDRVGVLRLYPQQPKYIEFRLRANKYLQVRVGTDGLIWCNNILAGLYCPPWTETEAIKVASNNHMEIVGVVYVNIES